MFFTYRFRQSQRFDKNNNFQKNEENKNAPKNEGEKVGTPGLAGELKKVINNESYKEKEFEFKYQQKAPNSSNDEKPPLPTIVFDEAKHKEQLKQLYSEEFKHLTYLLKYVVPLEQNRPLPLDVITGLLFPFSMIIIFYFFTILFLLFSILPKMSIIITRHHFCIYFGFFYLFYFLFMFLTNLDLAGTYANLLKFVKDLELFPNQILQISQHDILFGSDGYE